MDKSITILNWFTFSPSPTQYMGPYIFHKQLKKKNSLCSLIILLGDSSIVYIFFCVWSSWSVFLLRYYIFFLKFPYNQMMSLKKMYSGFLKVIRQSPRFSGLQLRVLVSAFRSMFRWSVRSLRHSSKGVKCLLVDGLSSTPTCLPSQNTVGGPKSEDIWESKGSCLACHPGVDCRS